MITAVDTNVLLDILAPDPVFGPASAEAMRAALAEGGLIACDVVWAELAAHFGSSSEADYATSRLGLQFSTISAEAAFEAGTNWILYRERGGSRSRVNADFLIGAHALLQADRLLTRDRGFYRSYFKHLSILDPSQKH